MRRVAKKTILAIKPYVPGKPIEEVKRELGLKDVIKLASNENPYGPSPQALQAIKQAAKELNRYPDGDCFYLRKELAKRLNVKPQQLIFGNGSDELIVLCVRAFVNEGDEVIIFGESNRADKLAEGNDSISYELITAISQRVKRRLVRR